MLVKLAEQAASCAPASCGAAATLSIDGNGGGIGDGGICSGGGIGDGGGASGGTKDTGGEAGDEAGGAPGEAQPTTGVTHPDLAPLVAVQWSSGDGPIPRAIRTGRPVGADDLLVEHRWPAYRAMALEAGVRSSTTLPFRHDGVTVTVTVCGFRPGLMDERTRTATTLVGNLATQTLLRDHLCEQALTQAEQLDTALRTRPVVDQACGIIMYILGCDADDAFDLLRRQSQHANSKLLDVARQVVATRGGGLSAGSASTRRS